MMRPRLLDLYCSSFGAGMGYVRAGFEVVGVDKVQRRDMPENDHIKFIKADVLDVLPDLGFLSSFDVIHASPPCQTFSRTKHLRNAQGKGTDKQDLISVTRDALLEVGRPYVIENVEGAPLREDLLLCGTMFPELRVQDETGQRFLQRHRIFESTEVLAPPSPCDHKGAGVRALGVYGSKGDNIPSGGQTARSLQEGRELMGIDWMSWAALIEAIPPAYTKHIGNQIREQRMM